ncbi:MAG: acetyl-CoA C-acetyltransferase, partial [Acidobacteriota bacterium]
SAAQMIRLGEADTVLAGGMESMSQAPFVIRGIRSGLRMGHADLQDSLLVSLRDDFSGCYMAETAVNLAREKGISREEQDRFALRSQKAAEAAYREGKFQEEIVPIKIQEKKKGVPVTGG